MDSIVQTHTDECWLCGMPARYGEPLDKHHCFGGALRKKADKLGLVVYLHHSSCHIFGVQSAHQCGATSRLIKQTAQKAAMQQYGWSREDFIHEFGQNWLD